MKQYPTMPQDWFNYIAHGKASNALIQYIIRFDRTIDYGALKKAVYNSIITEPILGCRFSIERPFPKWISEDFEIRDICCLKETLDIEHEINNALSQELNASEKLPIMVFLITDQTSDVIVIKMNHAICDGAGSRYYIELLAACYTKIRENNSDCYQNISPKRSTSDLYNELGINEIEEYFEPEKIDFTSSWGFPANQEKEQKNTFSYQLKSFENLEFFKIKNYANRNNTTINALLISAYFFGLIQVLQPSSGQLREVQITSDLRKYLPENSNQTICNLSAILNVRLPVIYQNFKKIVAEATTATEKANKPENIIHGTIANDLCCQSGFSGCADMFDSDWENILKTGLCSPMLSNLGVLIPDDIQFGDTAINEICFIPPAFFTPAFMLGVSTFKNKLSFCASYYTPNMQPVIIEKLLGEIEYFLNKLTA